MWTKVHLRVITDSIQMTALHKQGYSYLIAPDYSTLVPPQTSWKKG